MWRYSASSMAVRRGVTCFVPRPFQGMHYSTIGKVRVSVKTADGTRCELDAPAGLSLMQAIRDVAKLEMDGACDGCMQCSTCHVYIARPYFERTPKPTEEELDVLDKALDVEDTSRLACQVILTPELDGIDVTLPQNVKNLIL